MKRQKFNYFRFSIFIVILIAIIVGIVLLVKHIKYTKTYEYKLLNVGYTMEDVELILDKLSDSKKDILLNKKYSSEELEFLKEKYFIFSHFDDYIKYREENDEYPNNEIVAIINTEANIDWFDNEKETDTSLNELMLVNRLYGLKEDYTVEDIVDVPTKYAYDGKKLSNTLMDSLISLCEDAKEAGFTFVVSEGYRTFAEQQKLYNNYAESYSRSEADKYVARPGHSEYETGLSFDLEPYNKAFKDPKESEEYKWLLENAYRYGFIFRFNEDKEYLTKFQADTWRLRYVGSDAASMIKNEGICFEEYYAYFVRGDK